MTSVSSDRRQGLNSSAAIKVPCDSATTAQITLSGLQTVDGVGLASGDRVLVKNQTNPIENGIYEVDTGHWSRDLDFDGAYDALQGTLVMVLNGTANANTYWRVASTGGVVFGTTSVTFAQALFGDASILSFVQSGAGAQPRSVQSKERDWVSIIDFMTAAEEADVRAGTLAIDVGPKIQLAVNAAANVIIPAFATCAIGTQVVLASACAVHFYGICKPFDNSPAAGTALFKATASDCEFIGYGKGGIDGRTAAFNKWCGIQIVGVGAFIENCGIRGLHFQNVAIDETSAYSASIQSVVGAWIKDNYLKNCGVIGNVAGGGFGIYAAYCDGIVISGNQGKYVGSSFINESCCVGARISNNKIAYATLFGYKGGFGPGLIITADAAPAATTFTVAKDAFSTSTLIVGQDFAIPQAAQPWSTGTIKSIADNGTYYTITTAAAMDEVPSVGENIQRMSTDTTIEGNHLTYSGENGLDYNGANNLLITGNTFVFPGAYQDVGVTAGVCAGIWTGYDFQGANHAQVQTGIKITDNTIRYSHKAGIHVITSSDVTVNDNRLFGCNNADGAIASIDINRTSAYRSEDVSVHDNSIRSGKQQAIFVSFSRRTSVQANKINNGSGIELDSVQQGTVIGNHIVTTTAATSNGILISNTAGAGNAGGVLIVSKNYVNAPANACCYQVTDANFTQEDFQDDNILVGATTPITHANRASMMGAINSGPLGSGLAQRGNIRLAPAAGATTALGTFQADVGTSTMVLVRGNAWSAATSTGETFEVIYHGNTAVNAVIFTSLGSSPAGAFLAAGDFTISVTGAVATCNYKNNEAGAVSMVAEVLAFGRY